MTTTSEYALFIVCGDISHYVQYLALVANTSHIKKKVKSLKFTCCVLNNERPTALRSGATSDTFPKNHTTFRIQSA
jgi:hypothetical protein